MTEEQKEILITRMIDSPSSLSDEELEMILQDEELLSLYNVSAALGNACFPQPELDMHAEWESFRKRIRRRQVSMRWQMRVAAIFLGVIFASAIAIKIINNLIVGEQSPVIAKVEQSPESTADDMNFQSSEEEMKAAETEKNTLAEEGNYSSISISKTATCEANQGEAKLVDSERDEDIDEFLRLQQARVDNDLAVMAAESYMEEYDDIALLITMVEAYTPQESNIIGMITME